MVKVTTKKAGQTYRSIKEAAEKSGIPYMTLYMRVSKLGWSLARALNTPVRSYNKA